LGIRCLLRILGSVPLLLSSDDLTAGACEFKVAFGYSN
jgi:hypothetical protein